MLVAGRSSVGSDAEEGDVTLKGRLATLAVVASIWVAMVAGGFSYLIFMMLLVVAGLAAGIAWRWIPEFWKTVASGAAGGALAGLVILAPGFRWRCAWWPSWTRLGALNSHSVEPSSS